MKRQASRFGRAWIGALLIAALAVAQQANAATYVVDTVNDDAGLTACTGAAADCSLRGAIADANGAGGSNTITFDSSVFNPGTITLASMLPNITGTLTIDGPGASLLTVEGMAGFGLMYVDTGADLTVNGVTFANASTTSSGGAMYVTGATLTVTNSVFSNDATTAFGGALYIVNGSTATIGDTTFANNAAHGRGGAIYLASTSTLALRDCTLSGNHTDTSATAGLGGAVYLDSADVTVTVTNCTLTGNASISGGAFYSYGTLTLTNSTIAGNTATSSSGGVYNRGVTLNLNNSIISGNTQAGGSSQCDDVNSSSITNARNSLIEDNLSCVNGTNVNNLTGDPMLGALADNGGPTQTMALQSGSPAIDAGDNALAVDENGAALAVDQRGYTRIVGGTVDMGAFEVGSNPNFVVDTTSDADLEGCSTATNDCSLRGAITLANAQSQPVAISFDATVFASAQTITLTSTLPTITNSNGVSINGTGTSLLTVDGAGSYRVFSVNAGADVTLKNLTIAHGYSNKGGGINSSGTLTVSNVFFNTNVATNTAGGGIYLNNGSATVTASTFTGNTATGDGGAIDNNAATLTVINSTFTGNAATHPIAGYGGAIYNVSGGTTTVINSTVDGNDAVYGGGIYSQGTFTLHNSIVADNTSGGDCLKAAGTFDVQYSLIKDSSCGVTAGTNGNLTGDPMLDVLADNGGPTQTMALQAGSPAIDAGSNALAVDENSNPLSYDQRGSGYPRIVAATVDMGAYERDTTPPSLQSFTRFNPATQATSADTLVFQATFSEAVQNVDATDFSVIGGSTATISSVTTSDSIVWNITVSGGDLAGYNGGVALLLAGSEDIADLADNLLPTTQPATDESYIESNARVCYVNGSVIGGNDDGSSWGNAYADLQSALQDTQCSQVWVAMGVYKPGTSDPNASFTIRPGVAVYGGFVGTETSVNQRVPAIDTTVLSGDIGGDDSVDPNGVDASYTDINNINAYNVVIMDGRGQFPAPTITATTVLDGFTITGGDAEGSFPVHSGGGGLACVAFSSGECSPTLSNLSFSGNNSGDVGGAIYALGAGATSSPTLNAVTFRGNHAVADGGAVYFDGSLGGVSTASLTNVSFSGNQADGNGGAIFDQGVSGNSSSQLTNVTFSGNQAGSDGGAIYNEAGGSGGVSAAVLKNVILWGDSAGGSGPEMKNASGAAASVSYSVIAGGCPTGATCNFIYFTDPLLGMLGDNGGYSRTMALSPASPAISTGTNSGCPATDQRGVTRPQGPSCDIGAYELLDDIFVDGFEASP